MVKANGLSRQLRSGICVGMLVALAPLMLSCYGRFPMTHAVYHMNNSIGRDIGESRTGDKLAKSVAFWVLVIIPVYEVAMVGDAIILNLVEFWTGDSVDIGSAQESDGVRVALQPTADRREAVLTVSHDDALITEQHVIKISSTAFEIRDVSGKLTGKVFKTSAGDIQLADAQGQIIRTLKALDLEALSRN